MMLNETQQKWGDRFHVVFSDSDLWFIEKRWNDHLVHIWRERLSKIANPNEAFTGGEDRVIKNLYGLLGECGFCKEFGVPFETCSAWEADTVFKGDSGIDVLIGGFSHQVKSWIDSGREEYPLTVGCFNRNKNGDVRSDFVTVALVSKNHRSVSFIGTCTKERFYSKRKRCHNESWNRDFWLVEVSDLFSLSHLHQLYRRLGSA